MPASQPGDYSMLMHPIEGSRIADLCWGTANAKYAVLRFGIKSNVLSRNFCVALRNGPSVTHSLIYLLAASPVSSTTYKDFSLVVPPCTIGTWPTDNNYALYISFVGHTGSTYQTANTGVWQAGNFLGTSVINNTPAGNFQMSVGDVGLYADPNVTGVAPEFQGNHIEDDLQDCLRYWYPAYRMDGVCNSATNGYVWMANYVPMRVSPARTLVGSLRLHDGFVAPNATAISDYNTNVDSQSLLATASGFTIGKTFRTLVDGQTANYIAVSAR